MRAENPFQGTAMSVSLRVLLTLCASCAVLLLAFPTSTRAAACPNEVIRAEQGTAALSLPDCRAYEFVSPGSTPFIGTGGFAEGVRASTTGNGLAYWTRYPAEDAEGSGERYLATRGASAWSTESATPQASPISAKMFNCGQGLDFSPDLSRSILADGWNPAEDPIAPEPESYCSESEEDLAPGAPRGYGNLYLREGTGPYQLVNLTPEGVTPANAVLRAYTSDFNHILFEEAAPLTQGAPSEGTLLYEWSGGALDLVSVLPNGEPVAGKLADSSGGISPYTSNLASITHPVSDDGERVFFNANGNLYLRKNATQPPTAIGACTPTEADKACTVQVDLKKGGKGPSGGGVFWGASPDGSRAFFATESRLTGDSTATPGKPDLYEYTVANGSLKDLTHTGTFEPANVRGLSGLSEDASHLYFVARGVLEGTGENSNGEVAQSFSANLYLLDGKDVSFVATLDGADSSVWQENLSNPSYGGALAAVTSPSGRYLAFGSVVDLTGFESGGKQQIFLYDAQDGQIECVSCSSEAAPPTGDTSIPNPYMFSPKIAYNTVVYLARRVLDDGRVFFDTPNPLVPTDENGAKDVYEYQEGELQLISTGTAVGDSAFFDADLSGNNVFFATSQDLVPSDTSNGLSIYDARVNGGFSEPPPTPPCEGEGCRGSAPSAEGAEALGSLGFIGPEEGPRHPRVLRCKRGFVKRHGACRKRGRRHHSRAKQPRHAGSKGRNAK